MSAFVAALCDNNLKALIIDGEPPAEELEKAFTKILNEYLDNASSNEMKVYLSLFKEVNILKITIDQINIIVGILTKYYARPFADELNRLLRVKFVFDPANPHQYDDNLKRCINRSKGLLIDLQLKQVQLDGFQKKIDTKGGKPDRTYFQRMMITLADHAGFRFFDEITVFEYCERLSRYVKHIENQKKTK